MKSHHLQPNAKPKITRTAVPEELNDTTDEYLLGPQQQQPQQQQKQTTPTFGSSSSSDLSSRAPHHPPSAVRSNLKDFYWSSEQHMHIARNRAMLTKYPQIKRLMGYDPWTKYPCIAIVLLQAVIGIFVAHRLSWFWYFFVAYTVGATCNGALFLANHEVTHYLAFQKRAHNDLFAIFVLNFPIVIPFSMMFKTYHADHHRYLGWEDIDPDLPTDREARWLSNPFGKLFFLWFQVLFYCIRPMFVTWVRFRWQHTLNYVVMLGLHGYLLFGLGWWWATGYWILSGFFAGSIHPLAGHFLAEHYVFDPETSPNHNNNKEGGTSSTTSRKEETAKDEDDAVRLYAPQETFSYYGPLNRLSFNAGYHVEHHDFPNIPYTRIAQLHDIAPEFYKNLKQVDSWGWLLWKFWTDKRMGSYARVKRERGAGLKRGKVALLPTGDCSGVVM